MFGARGARASLLRRQSLPLDKVPVVYCSLSLKGILPSLRSNVCTSLLDGGSSVLCRLSVLHVHLLFPLDEHGYGNAYQKYEAVVDGDDGCEEWLGESHEIAGEEEEASEDQDGFHKEAVQDPQDGSELAMGCSVLCFVGGRCGG